VSWSTGSAGERSTPIPRRTTTCPAFLSIAASSPKGRPKWGCGRYPPSFHALGTGRRTPEQAGPGIAAVDRVEGGVRRRARRALHQRSGPREHPEGRTFSVIPEIPGGVCSPAELRRIADVAEKYLVPLLKLTGGQRIDLVGVAKDDCPTWARPGDAGGLRVGKSYRTCKAVLDRITAVLVWVTAGPRKGYRGSLSRSGQPGKLNSATAGCRELLRGPRQRRWRRARRRWQVGDLRRWGGRVARSKGRLACVVDSQRPGPPPIGAIHSILSRSAKYKERTYTFVERAIAKIRAIVVDDSEGNGLARFDRALEEWPVRRRMTLASSATSR